MVFCVHNNDRLVSSTDMEPPVLSCPSTIITSDISVQWSPVTVTDNSGLMGGVTCTHGSGDNFAAGETTVICFARDEAGNRGRCSFVVIVGESEGSAK